MHHAKREERVKIELLYFDGCPNYEPTKRLVEEILTAEGLKADIQEIPVNSGEEALALRFPGSPTVRVNGRDIEPGAENKSGFGLQCRVYREGNRILGVPPRRLLTAALLETSPGESHNCCRRG